MISSFFEQHKNRIVGLDIIRFIAIMMVVYGHGVYLIPGEYKSQYLKLELIKMDGVSIFFVLSGFLIGGILFKIIEKTNYTKRDLINFWIRRWFRTVPNYLFVMLLIVIYCLKVSFPIEGLNYKYLFFIQNLYSPHPSFFPEAWSLAVEEWFYFLFPLSCFILHKTIRNKPNSILISALIFILFPLILRILRYEIGFSDHDLEIRKVVLLRLDSIMYGVLGAYIFYKRPIFWNTYKLPSLYMGIAIILFFLVAPSNIKYFYSPLYYNLESIATLLFIPYLSTIKTTRIILLDKVIVLISVISYSMYLLNLSPIIVLGIPLINDLMLRSNIIINHLWIFNYILYWFLTVFTSYYLYKYFEYPMTTLRDKIKF